MAKVFAPLLSWKAKGVFGGTVQITPEPYTKGPISRADPVAFTFDIVGENQEKREILDYAFPLTGVVSNLCEMDRIMKVVPISGGMWGGGGKGRMEFEEWARLQHLAFQEARKLALQLTEEQKTSWTIFGHQFYKQDFCTLIGVPVTYFEVFMSLNIFMKLSGWGMKLWAPVMTEELSVEAAARGWRATYWYYLMKKASLRRAWVLYRKKHYDIKSVMKITEVWKKFKKWHDIKFEIMKQADELWKYW